MIVGYHKPVVRVEILPGKAELLKTAFSLAEPEFLEPAARKNLSGVLSRMGRN